MIFLGFPTKKQSLVLDFPSGKHCFSCILDGFGVIFLGFPTKKHSLVLDFPSGKHSFS